MSSLQNNTTIRVIVATILGLVVLIAGWVMILNSAQAANGRQIATNTANIGNVEDNISEIKIDLRRVLDKIDSIDAKLPGP